MSEHSTGPVLIYRDVAHCLSLVNSSLERDWHTGRPRWQAAPLPPQSAPTSHQRRAMTSCGHVLSLVEI